MKAVSYLPVELVDPSPETRNSRQRYDEASINDVAKSIQEHGVLQPILVSPKPDGRFDTIFGNRRLLASRRAGSAEIPAVVRDGVTEREKFVWNLVENIQRQGLSNKERANSIRALAESGGGVREICAGRAKMQARSVVGCELATNRRLCRPLRRVASISRERSTSHPFKTRRDSQK
jgi:ParB family transcriptional regulator, chromosome partitioning protein